MEPTKQKFLLIRHAESEFNLERATSKDRSSVIYNKYLIDCKITNTGESQISFSMSKINPLPISLVLVSPLKRALQTAKFLFKDHPSNPRFVVVPYLRERVSASCDLSDFIDKPLKEFEEFDWSNMMKLIEGKKGVYWLSEELCNVEAMDEIRKISDPDDQKMEIVKWMEEYFKSEKKENGNKKQKFETVKIFQKNIEKLIKFLAQLKEKRILTGELGDTIAIVSHGGTLKELCMRGGIENYIFDNCEMKEFFL